MENAPVKQISSASGTSQADDETIKEYVVHVGEERNVDRTLVEHALSYVTEYYYSEGRPDDSSGFDSFLEGIAHESGDTVLYASTPSIYGSQAEPLPEEMDVTVNTGYEASKMGRESYAEYFFNHYDMTMAGIRFFSVYQGYGDAEENNGEYGNVIAQFADDIANRDSPVLYEDGEQTRDFMHVDHIVRGLELAAEHELDGIYNLGTEESYNFNNAAEMFNDELGTNVVPEYSRI